MEDKQLVPVNPEVLLAQAIEKGLPVETMERLLEMRRELKAEWAREQYFVSLARFQAKCPAITKSAKVDFVSKKTGKRVRYNYAPLDVIVGQIKEALEQHGFSYTITTRQEKDTVTAICNAHHVDGHTELTEFTIPIDPDDYMKAAQKVASALTYAKRYAFCNAFGILTGDEDNDGQGGGDGNDEEEPPGSPKTEQKQPEQTEPTDQETALPGQLEALLASAEGRVNGEAIQQVRDNLKTHPTAYKWMRKVIPALEEEIKRQEALLAANAKQEPAPEKPAESGTPLEVAKAMGNLKAAAGVKDKVTQGDLPIY